MSAGLVSSELADRDLLVAELALLRRRVRGEVDPAAELQLAERRTAHGRPSGVDEVARGFGLTAFERATLVLAAGPDLVATTAEELLARTGSPRLSFGAALAMLPEPHWSALTPPGPLRRWQLVRLTEPSAPTTSALVVDERILHHLVGAGHLDETIAALAQPVSAVALPPTLDAVAETVVTRWQAAELVVLHGPQAGNLWAVAAAAGREAQLRLMRLRSADLAGNPYDQTRLLRRLERETVLLGCAWAVDARGQTATQVRELAELLVALDAPVVLVSESASGGDVPGCASVAVPRVRAGERAELLAAALDRPPADGEVQRVSGVFDLPVDALTAVAADVTAGHPLWSACRRRARAGFGRLATVRQPRAGWDDLVLPPAPVRQLEALAAGVRHRHQVLEDWGFAGRTSRGLGTTALFAGPSGTGKTLAAEVIAHDLGLDLVHVDLSHVVSKYIGESEKHLAALFDAAESGGAVLLFDEADALFGKRSEVRDSHDRYANLEVGYLLQRMEEFRGLAVLTTNARSTLDPAFSRRLNAIITFPYPDAALRERLWRQAFPPATPTADLDHRWLSAIDLPGGGIAAAALTAAYLAAAEDAPVGARHVTEAARWELAKTGRTLAVAPPRRRGG